MTLKVKVVIKSICLGIIISKTVGDTDSVTMEHLYEMTSVSTMAKRTVISPTAHPYIAVVELGFYLFLPKNDVLKIL